MLTLWWIEKKSLMEQKAAQVFSQQEREQQTRDLKQQDTKLNALTKEEGNVPLFLNCVSHFPPTGHIYLNLHLFCIFFFSGVAVRKGPKCRRSTTKKTIPKGWTESKETHTLPKIQNNKKKRSTKKVNHRTTNRKPGQLANREATHRTICTQSTN